LFNPIPYPLRFLASSMVHLEWSVEFVELELEASAVDEDALDDELDDDEPDESNMEPASL
jgi:hypothetical protein